MEAGSTDTGVTGSVGQSIYALVADRVDEIIRATYVEAWACAPEEIPDSLIARERSKLQLMLDGDFGPEHSRMLQELVRDHIGAGLDHADYMRAFGIYVGNLVEVLDRGLGPEDPHRGARMRYLLLATHTECGLALEHYFRAVATQEWAERAALAQSFEAEVMSNLGAVTAALDAMESNASRVHGGAQEAFEAGRASVDRAEGAAERVAKVAAATQQISGAAHDLSRQVGSAKERSAAAKLGAERATSTVEELADHSGRVVEVVQLIRSIAEQTRMLALNASIEAARAGEAGRGFAVVASEVKTLAHDTAQATDTIAQRVDTIRGSADQARAAMAEVEGAIRDIDGLVTGIATVGEEQSASTGQIAEQTDGTSTDVAAMAADVAKVAGFAESTSRDAEQVRGEVERARAAAGQLEVSLREFLTSIRGGDGA